MLSIEGERAEPNPIKSGVISQYAKRVERVSGISLAVLTDTFLKIISGVSGPTGKDFIGLRQYFAPVLKPQGLDSPPYISFLAMPDGTAHKLCKLYICGTEPGLGYKATRLSLISEPTKTEEGMRYPLLQYTSESSLDKKYIFIPAEPTSKAGGTILNVEREIGRVLICVEMINISGLGYNVLKGIGEQLSNQLIETSPLSF